MVYDLTFFGLVFQDGCDIFLWTQNKENWLELSYFFFFFFANVAVLL